MKTFQKSIKMVRGLFKSLDSTLSTLEEYKHINEVQNLLKIHQSQLSLLKPDLNKDKKHILMVFEGMDGSGKSTLAKLTNRRVRGVIKSTPPECVQNLRSFFDSQEFKLRRAFYSLGNYIASYEINDELERNHVILDRFWHSTAAYTIANSDIQAQNDDYEWPLDLIKPDIIFYLYVDEHNRDYRMRQRNLTAEESLLKKDAELRQKIDSAFRNMKNPGVTLIDSNATPKIVRESVLDILTKQFNINCEKIYKKIL